EFFLKPSESFSDFSLILIISAAGAVFIISAGACFLLEKRRKNEIEQLINYLREIENGVYSLKISENAEDEISKLSNEIYKITVLLRETAQENKTQTKVLAAYLADISHQIKTPLTCVSIMLDNILDSPDMDEKTKRDFLSETRRQINLITSLCVTLLKLSKLDSGTVEFTSSKIRADELINAALKNVAVLLDIKNIGVSLSGNLDAYITADIKWQTEAISNIIKNAAEHSSENSEIDISVENSGLFVKIRIKDEGEGIDDSDLGHIFERFYKAKSSSTQSFGIGLALAKSVIEKDNGSVYASSKKGEGTVFTVAYRLV
ncbi:MAG: HAMP domain-containing histidine kinase, partial [Oscillospiraceae bacterium]|nr:HAMP domain-containing histidine kinase [Oscillospiraceae bacterium]